ncbi:hypothetical protein [Marinoscillum furvescens]|uniref:Uncharacterized protein n=1 Tax=Marinoscillum furvescens DSM 4134 TaxID=1122208 RepID=A0A3D9L6I8_MARFU|nr:hypothetical protein [Marinoscillum furvescens]REE01084.1 hypothetical protein C7460_104104 [Marinoscillum furvescens DSM 4134]
MTRYFAKITATYVAKNKLCQELANIAKTKDAKILEGTDELEQYLENLKEHVALANAHHPRCKPEELTIYTPGDSHTCYMVYIPGLFHMSIFKEATP